MRSQYLHAREAAAELGISLATLYAYVSRGLIRSEDAGGDKRSRRYHAEDVQRLKERKEQRRDPAKVAEQALYWGDPIMESAITLIEDGRYYYRGQDALRLAGTCTVEQVAALIWTGEPEDAGKLFRAQWEPLPERCLAVLRHLERMTTVERFQVLLPLMAADDLAAYDLRPASVAQTGARILRSLAVLAAGSPTAAGSIVDVLRDGWMAGDARAASLLNAALILCADHELNVTSFAARCVASAGSTPYDVVLAGLSALQGRGHGGLTRRVDAFLDEARSPAGVRAAISGRLQRGEEIPGFGHMIYPEGDPRARLLLDLSAAAFPDSPAVALTRAVVEEAGGVTGEHPGLDLGLATLSRALGLPAGGGLTLFALGRTIGWIGHAIEQYQSGRTIRPRARYVGVRPRADEDMGQVK